MKKNKRKTLRMQSPKRFIVYYFVSFSKTSSISVNVF